MNPNEKNTLRGCVESILYSAYPAEDRDAHEALLSVPLPDTGAARIAWGLVKKCSTGDASCIKLLREITGEADASPVIVYGPGSFASLSDAELEALANEGGAYD